MTILPSFYDADRLERVAVNLFYGWGYNFYRVENQLRADDLLIRSKVGWLLGAARASVVAAEAAYRREFLPPPSRAKPRPDPEAVAGAQRLETWSAAIGQVAARINALPVPENDRMTQLVRHEAETLARLLDCDRRLAGQAETLRAMLDGQTSAWMLTNADAMGEGLMALDRSLFERQSLLM